MKRIKRFFIDAQEMEIHSDDSGAFRSYELTAYGDTLEEMEENATISATDQEGGEVGSPFSLGDAPAQVYKKGVAQIGHFVDKKMRDDDDARREYAIDRIIDERKERRSRSKSLTIPS